MIAKNGPERPPVYDMPFYKDWYLLQRITTTMGHANFDYMGSANFENGGPQLAIAKLGSCIGYPIHAERSFERIPLTICDSRGYRCVQARTDEELWQRTHKITAWFMHNHPLIPYVKTVGPSVTIDTDFINLHEEPGFVYSKYDTWLPCYEPPFGKRYSEMNLVHAAEQPGWFLTRNETPEEMLPFFKRAKQEWSAMRERTPAKEWVRDEHTLGGEERFAGTRISVKMIKALMEKKSRADEDDILEAYPSLCPSDLDKVRRSGGPHEQSP